MNARPAAPSGDSTAHDALLDSAFELFDALGGVGPAGESISSSTTISKMGTPAEQVSRSTASVASVVLASFGILFVAFAPGFRFERMGVSGRAVFLAKMAIPLLPPEERSRVSPVSVAGAAGFSAFSLGWLLD